MAQLVKKLPASAGDVGGLGLIPDLGRSPGEGKWQLTPVFLPGNHHGQKSLMCYILRGHKELEAT